MPAALTNGSAQNGEGFWYSTFTVWLSTLVTLTSLYEPAVYAEVAGSAAYAAVNTTSSAVKGLPSCHCTFLLSFQVMDLPSLETPPLARVGTSAAKMGTKLPSGSQAPKGS